MSKIFAYIALCTLLAAPLSAIVSSIAEDNKSQIVIAVMPDAEDADEDGLSRDTESDHADEVVMEQRELLLLSVSSVRLREVQQSLLFKDHHKEVFTPPPRKNNS